MTTNADMKTRPTTIALRGAPGICKHCGEEIDFRRWWTEPSDPDAETITTLVVEYVHCGDQWEVPLGIAPDPV